MSKQTIWLEFDNQERKIEIDPHLTVEQITKKLKENFHIQDGITALRDPHTGEELPLSSLKNVNVTPTTKLILVADEKADEEFDRADEIFDLSREKTPFLGKQFSVPIASVDVLEYLQTKSAFRFLNLRQILDSFNKYADLNGNLSNEAFHKCLNQFLPELEVGSARNKKLVVLVLDRVFQIFDSDNDGLVNFPEFATGMGVLCNETMLNKVKLAFTLFDYDKDGRVSLKEMTQYMVSFFEVAFELSENVKLQFGGLSAREVGTCTAEVCFQELDKNSDGSLSFEEFKIWYIGSQKVPDIMTVNPPRVALLSRSVSSPLTSPHVPDTRMTDA